METSKFFFRVAGMLFTIAMLALTIICALRLYLTEGGWAGTFALTLGLACTTAFVVGISTWNDSWATDHMSKILCKVSLFGAIPLLIGFFGLTTVPTSFTDLCLHLGAIVFTVPIFIAALWGFILHAKYSWRLFAD